MSAENKLAKQIMHKRVEMKEDGRVLIYYNFTEQEQEQEQEQEDVLNPVEQQKEKK